jgi:ABC-type transport system involved in multi-copper enzyme maturation permease subunit
MSLFGPVLFYDMIRSARRGRYFLLRMLYAGFLVFILFTVWLSIRAYNNDLRQVSFLALQFFEAFMMVQLVLVTLLTPAFVAGSIAEEKDRKTMEFLLATDLRNREIVLSKFGARVANLTLLLLTGLPFLALIQFLGGVDPTLVLTGFAATGVTMFGLAGLSILNSVQMKRPRDAIAVTYLFLIAYVAVGMVAYGVQQSPWIRYINFPIWFGSDPPTLSTLITWFNTGNLLLVIGQLGRGGSLIAPGLLEKYAIFHGSLGIVCLVWATIRLRKVALRQAFAPVGTKKAKRRKRPPVGELPMLWKEVCVEGGMHANWMARILFVILVVLTLAPGVLMIYFYLKEGGGVRDLGRGMNEWVRGAGAFVASLTLVGLGVRASTSIGTERDKQTFDSLLTSPMDSNTILGAKFIGTMLSMRLAWIWLGLIWGLGIITGGLHVFALPLLLTAWVFFASFFTMLGLWFSMLAKTTMRATVYTVLFTIGLGGGHWVIWLCCGPLLFLGGGGRGPGDVGEMFLKFQAGLTPPFSMGMLAFTSQDFINEWSAKNTAELVGFCVLGIFIWAAASAIFWFGILSPRFRIYTGRQEERFPEAEDSPRWDARRYR